MLDYPKLIKSSFDLLFILAIGYALSQLQMTALGVIYLNIISLILFFATSGISLEFILKLCYFAHLIQ